MLQKDLAKHTELLWKKYIEKNDSTKSISLAECHRLILAQREYIIKLKNDNNKLLFIVDSRELWDNIKYEASCIK